MKKKQGYRARLDGRTIDNQGIPSDTWHVGEGGSTAAAAAAAAASSAIVNGWGHLTATTNGHGFPVPNRTTQDARQSSIINY